MRWGLIGASTIAAQHMIRAIRATEGEVLAIASTDEARARTFAKTHGIAIATASVTDLLALPGIGAVYISSTNEKHHAQAMAA
ncbi:MAG: Gfo/Idh/MocA family oxidoreductase, partial [Paracoccaceae bacterium]